jgi:UDP-N-acetylmuramoyl-L-alanyl-D-glutamate--2,6-diaminopimelate ligase
VQHRVDGVAFDVALFTNLTRDHLDYHGTMARYRAAKAQLFRMPGLAWAVLNFDDPFGLELAKLAARRGIKVVGFGFNRMPAGSPGVHCLHGRNLKVDHDGVSFEIAAGARAVKVRSALIGRFNASNVLATLATLVASGVAVRRAAPVLAHLKPVPGRTECYGGGEQPLVMVDYAHTPDALEKVLLTLRDTLKRPAAAAGRRARPRRARGAVRRAGGGRLICVFGCGGDRDPGKRPLMGRIATRIADHTIITSDNPRGENAHAIIADILEGVTGACSVVPDRTFAIHEAVAMANAGDVVLIAGKGHEDYQEIAGVRHPYSDAATARSALKEVTR